MGTESETKSSNRKATKVRKGVTIQNIMVKTSPGTASKLAAQNRWGYKRSQDAQRKLRAET